MDFVPHPLKGSLNGYQREDYVQQARSDTSLLF